VQGRVSAPQHQRKNTTLSISQPKMADAIFGFGLTHALFRAELFVRKNIVVGKFCRKAATAFNEHIAKIAALPRVDRKSVFLRSLLALIKCWQAATSAICHHVSRHFETEHSENE